jgi:hypothetical protein
MKKILFFTVLFLTVTLTSFAKTKVIQKVIKKDGYELKLTKEESNSWVFSISFYDGCGRICTTTFRVFCCLTDEDIMGYAEEQALNRLGADGCFIL